MLRHCISTSSLRTTSRQHQSIHRSSNHTTPRNNTIIRRGTATKTQGDDQIIPSGDQTIYTQDVKNLNGRLEAYEYLTRGINPRPIAWVTSMNEHGESSTAPYSFCSVASTDPPIVMFSAIKRQDGSKKLSVRNIELMKEFTISIIEPAQLDMFLRLSHGSKETNLPRTSCSHIKGQRFTSEVPFQLECVLDRVLDVGDSSVIFGRVVCIHTKNSVFDAIDRSTIFLSQIAGKFYGTTVRPVDLIPSSEETPSKESKEQ
eukprot:TRINITY_DN8435_c0_g1_i1.p1 TRINITY_DN8435_c0_g1~~TRINITY_DN8435_c0_g1_i1.p1  ORF type:complete len:259 (-),score=38.28 TRINITY_DN8435_c0_g1_i1:252-1028(-)